MSDSPTVETAIEHTINRLTAEVQMLQDQMQAAMDQALEDWLIVEACKDYDTIELSDAVIGKAWRKQWKMLRDKKRNLEKMIAALQDLRQIAGTPEGEKLRKKFDQEKEKYQ